MAKITIQVGGPSSERGASFRSDERFINCFFEMSRRADRDTLLCVKRPGLLLHNAPSVAATGRGVYAWNGNLYSVFGNNLYSNTTLLQTLGAISGRVRFTEALSAGVIPSLIVSTGTQAWIISAANVVTLITDIDLPSPHTLGLAYLDGFLFSGRGDRAEIYNSNLDAHGTWQATNFVSAENYGDKLSYITRFHNLIAAFGETTLEFFENVGTPSTTASPLAPVRSMVRKVGTPAINTVREVGDALIWVARSNEIGTYVAMLSGVGVAEISISEAWIDRLIANDGAAITSAYAFVVRSAGHVFYVLRLSSTSVAYDLHSQKWTIWSSDNAGSEVPFRFCDATSLNGISYLQDATDGSISRMDEFTYDDSGAPIRWEWQTGKYNAGARQRKRCNSIEIIGDRFPLSNAALLTIQYSDDDYGTFSAERIVNLFAERPRTWRLGSFSERAFRFRYTANLPLRIEAAELDIM